MINNNDAINQFIPISRFNKGEAGKIFKEVAEKGIKFVLKNNVPECVLLSPQKYDELLGQIEKYKLALETLNKLEDSKN